MRPDGATDLGGHRLGKRVAGWGASANQVDLDAWADVLPGVVGGVNGGFALDGEGEAGAVTQREAVGAGSSDQFSGDACLLIVKEADLAAKFHQPTPGEIGADSTEQQPGMHLGEVHGAEEPAVEEGENLIAASFVEDDGQDCRRIENRWASQATPPSRAVPLRGALQSIHRKPETRGWRRA